MYTGTVSREAGVGEFSPTLGCVPPPKKKGVWGRTSHYNTKIFPQFVNEVKICVPASNFGIQIHKWHLMVAHLDHTIAHAAFNPTPL